MNTSISSLERGLHFRLAKSSDVEKILQIFQQNPSYDLEMSKNTIEDSVCINNGEVAAYGLLKGFAEAVMVLDHNISKPTQTKAFIGLMERAIRLCKEMKIADLHAFSGDPRFTKLLQDQFNFQLIDQTPLRLDLR